MTMIKVKKTIRDYGYDSDPRHNEGRRDFLAYGAKASAITLLLPKALGVALIKDAMAEEPTCPVSPQVKGGLMHIYSEGGSAMSARFINPIQSQFMSATVAANYGIAQDLRPFGGNGWMVSGGSPFGQLLVAPVGVPQATWDAVLRNVTLTAHYGAFKDDDGGGSGLGQIGGSAGLKPGVVPNDILINVSDARANWAKGLAAVKIGTPTVTSPTQNPLARAFSAPPGTGTDSVSWGNSVSAMTDLTKIFGSMFGTGSRNGSQRFADRSLCGANAAKTLANPTFGQDLFDPAKLSTDAVAQAAVGNLTNQEKGYLSAAFRTADGTVPGVMIQFGGRDYHNTGSQNIANRDYEEAQAVKMWLLGAYLAKAPSAMLMNSNGSALPDPAKGSFNAVQVNGITMNGTNSDGDTGGRFNAGFLLCYNPNGAGPAMRFTGNFNTASGFIDSKKVDASVASVPNAIGSLTLTALKFLGNDVNKAYGLMQANGVNSKMSDLILLI
jgi:hypothetical protein